MFTTAVNERIVKKVGPLVKASITVVRAMCEKDTLFQSSDIADAYLKYRPTYGPEIFSTIASFCKETASGGISDSRFSLAIDVGCGSGQSTLPLTKHFEKVIGLDVSEHQVTKAPTHISGLSFRVGPAEDLSFVDSGTVDLVTVAQALHWMDTKRLYPEVERVLKPGGAFVVYGYGKVVLDEPKAQEALNYLYEDVLGQYWADGRNQVEIHYQNYTLPFAGWRRNDSHKIERSWMVDELVGYLCSWSAYHRYLMDNPTGCAMPEIRQRLQTVYQINEGWSNEREVKVAWPVFMLMGHKPQA